VKHSPKFNQLLAVELAAALANATQDRLAMQSQMNTSILRSREMIAESRDLLARVDQALSRSAAKPDVRTHSEDHKLRTDAAANAAECERLARGAPTHESRIMMWQTRQLWIDIAYLAKNA
jgi:hypothetical protein